MTIASGDGSFGENHPNISPHKFWEGEKFAADAQTTMVCWTDDLDEQDEVSASDTVKYQIPREN